MKEHISFEPKFFKLTNKDGSEVIINSSHILYIICKKEIKTMYFTEPVLINGHPNWEIAWKNRKYGVRKLLEFLEGRGFIQINKTTIIRKTHFSGRDSDWKYVYVTMPFNRTWSKGNGLWKSIALPLGRTFAHQIKNHTFESFFSLKNNDGDIVFVHPLDIVFIELSRGIKEIYLEKPVCRNDKNDYKLKWMSRRPFEELLPDNFKFYFLKVHRRFYVRIDYPFRIDKVDSKYSLFLKKRKSVKDENIEVNSRNIPIGKNYIEQCIDVFSGKS